MPGKKNDLETEMQSFFIQIGNEAGLDLLSSKLIGILYLEPNEISIEDLSKKTGYSLASISNKMRFLEAIGFAQRIKKPKSKKVFYFGEKDVLKMKQLNIKKAFEVGIRPAKEIIPNLVEKYKDKKLKGTDKAKFDIIKNYYKQIIVWEKLIKNLQRALIKERKKL